MEPCPDPGVCRLLGRHIHGRDYEVWRGINVDPVEAERVRQQWITERNTAKKTPAPALKPVKTKPCNCGKPSGKLH